MTIEPAGHSAAVIGRCLLACWIVLAALGSYYFGPVIYFILIFVGVPSFAFGFATTQLGGTMSRLLFVGIGALMVLLFWQVQGLARGLISFVNLNGKLFFAGGFLGFAVASFGLGRWIGVPREVGA